MKFSINDVKFLMSSGTHENPMGGALLVFVFCIEWVHLLSTVTWLVSIRVVSLQLRSPQALLLDDHSLPSLQQMAAGFSLLVPFWLLVFCRTLMFSLPVSSSVFRAQLFKSKSQCIMYGAQSVGMKHRQAINEPKTEQRGPGMVTPAGTLGWSLLAWCDIG